ncbi:MAG: universal stress protein [Chitinophagaceae bacterium]
MTNILIPTDFSPASLHLAEQAILALEGSRLNIVLFHAFELPDSAFDLVGPSRKKPYYDLLTDAFRQSCKQLKEQHTRTVQKIGFKCMEGNSASLFRNFVDANDIDIIICPVYYEFVPVHKQSIDPRPFFKKSGVRILSDLNPRRKEIIVRSTKTAEEKLVASN